MNSGDLNERWLTNKKRNQTEYGQTGTETSDNIYIIYK